MAGLFAWGAKTSPMPTHSPSTQFFVQIKDIYKGSEAERKLDEQIRNYQDKAKKNEETFGRDFRAVEKREFSIKVGLAGGEGTSLKYGDRIPPSLLGDIQAKALDENSRSLKIQEEASGLLTARDWEERFRAYDLFTGWSCRRYLGKLAALRHWKDGKLKGPFIGWNRAGRTSAGP